MGLNELLAKLGPPIEDPEEETFILFSESRPDAQDLGFVDARASILTIPLGRDDNEVTITQSPALLNAAIKTGTTGAVLWRVSPRVAGWLTEPSNVLFGTDTLRPDSTVLELGCGISGVTALAVAPRVGTYVCTDQAYVLKQLRLNLAENAKTATRHHAKDRWKPAKEAIKLPKHSSSASPSHGSVKGTLNVQVLELDWETTSLTTLAAAIGEDVLESLDLVVACDCIYNSYLIDPLVRTCVEICRAREAKPVLCMMAQQLRSEDIFQEWLSAFARVFVVWRVPDELLDPSLEAKKGFALHVGMLRSAVTQILDSDSDTL